MRTEELENAEPTVVVIADYVVRGEELPYTGDALVIRMAEQYRQSEQVIRKLQKTLDCHGYILKQGVIYKVHNGTTAVNKITGKEAKDVKRKIKKFFA